MYHTVIRMVGDQMMAEDIVQEGFVRIFRDIGKFRRESGVYAWMKRIMVNEAIDHLRRKKRQLDSLQAESQWDQVPEQTGDDHDYEWNVERIHAAVKLLPPGCREVLNLYLFEGYSHQEIASVMDISESTSKTQYRRAKMLLRNQLKSVSNE